MAKKTAQLHQRDVVGLVAAFNAGRDPERVTQKYRLLAADPFTFLRGTCHLFYSDFPVDARFKQHIYGSKEAARGGYGVGGGGCGCN